MRLKFFDRLWSSLIACIIALSAFIIGMTMNKSVPRIGISKRVFVIMGQKDQVTAADIDKISSETGKKFAQGIPGKNQFLKDITVYPKSDQEVGIIIHSASTPNSSSCFPNTDENEIIDFVEGRLNHYAELREEEKRISTLNPENATKFPQLLPDLPQARAPRVR